MCAPPKPPLKRRESQKLALEQSPSGGARRHEARRDEHGLDATRALVEGTRGGAGGHGAPDVVLAAAVGVERRVEAVVDQCYALTLCSVR